MEARWLSPQAAICTPGGDLIQRQHAPDRSVNRLDLECPDGPRNCSEYVLFLTEEIYTDAARVCLWYKEHLCGQDWSTIRRAVAATIVIEESKTSDP